MSRVIGSSSRSVAGCWRSIPATHRDTERGSRTEPGLERIREVESAAGPGRVAVPALKAPPRAGCDQTRVPGRIGEVHEKRRCPGRTRAEDGQAKNLSFHAAESVAERQLGAARTVVEDGELIVV